MKIGYLGPRGTYTEMAALQYIGPADEGVEYPDIDDILADIEKGKIDKGIAPVENSIGGSVTNVIDSLIFDVNLYIQSELLLPIRHCLLMKENWDTIEKIYSHPQGLAQCRKNIRNRYPLSTVIETSSTAEAARIISENGEKNAAAIGNILCAGMYGLHIADKEISDRKKNVTRFIELSKNRTDWSFEGCKTSIAFSVANNPGELYRVLDIFCLWDLNLSKIESRPVKSRLGQYCFFVDIEGAKNPRDVTDALTMVERKTTFYKHIGSYQERR